MNHAEWVAFLENKGLLLEERQGEMHLGKNTGFTDNSALSTIVPLTHQGMLCVEGKDSEKFLQGQLSCDVTGVSEQLSCLGTACSPQGRAYSSFRIIRIPGSEPGDFLLRMRDNITEQTLTTLSKYSVFFKSEICNANNRYVGIGLFGQNSESLINKLFGQIPQDDNAVVFAKETIVIRVPGSCPRFECWSSPQQAQNNWQKLAADATVGNSDDWLHEDIKAGLGEVSLATSDRFIPQMLNLQAVGAVSFDKGCYTGQEIVARTQHRGKSKRFMTRILVTGAPRRLDAGTDLTNPQTGKNIATVVSAASTSEDTQQALVVILEDSAQDIQEVSLQQASFRIERQTLPYSLQT